MTNNSNPTSNPTPASKSLFTDSIAVKENVSVVVRDSRTGTILDKFPDAPPSVPTGPASSASSASSLLEELGSPSERSPQAMSAESTLPISDSPSDSPLVIRSITAFFIRAEGGNERLLSVPTKMGLRVLIACTPEELVVMRTMSQDIADEAGIEIMEREFRCSTTYSTNNKTPTGWPTNTCTYSPRQVKPATMKVGKIGGGGGGGAGGGGKVGGRIII
jgi:hypothetical protein